VTDYRDETRAAYDGVVELYASLFGGRLEGQPLSRAMIGAFAELVRATGNLRVADVGCGPGHLTAVLRELGLDVFGLDPFARLLHDPASERGFLDAHLLARRL
jgi:SAM-dependent methyltransferase